MRTVLNRIYSDYLMPSRLAEYGALPAAAKAAGYTQLSVRGYFRALGKPGVAAGRVLVHRHDIDSDVRTARKLVAPETRHAVTASYYFRPSTLDFGFMRQIEAAGSEASYHDDEVAGYAKRHRIRSAAAVRRRFPAIRAEFARNVDRIANGLGRPMATVASHGDFANRRLKAINHELLAEELAWRS